MAVGGAVDVFDKTGAFLGTIAGPRGLHGVAFGGKDKKTLYAIIFYGGLGLALGSQPACVHPGADAGIHGTGEVEAPTR